MIDVDGDGLGLTSHLIACGKGLHLTSDLSDYKSVGPVTVVELLHVVNVFQTVFGSITLRPFQ